MIPSQKISYFQTWSNFVIYIYISESIIWSEPVILVILSCWLVNKDRLWQIVQKGSHTGVTLYVLNYTVLHKSIIMYYQHNLKYHSGHRTSQAAKHTALQPQLGSKIHELQLYISHIYPYLSVSMHIYPYLSISIHISHKHSITLDRLVIHIHIYIYLVISYKL